MADATVEAKEPLRVAFDRRLSSSSTARGSPPMPACSRTTSWTTPSAWPRRPARHRRCPRPHLRRAFPLPNDPSRSTVEPW